MAKQRYRAGYVAAALALAVAAALALSGCALTLGSQQKTVESVANTSLNVGGTPELTIIVPNGEVRVAVGEADTFAARVTRRGQGDTQAAAQAAHDNLSVDFSQQGDQVTLEAKRQAPLPSNAGDEALLEVTVPEGTPLTIEVANGQVFVGPVGADATVVVANGQVMVTPRAGDAFSFAASVINGQFESGYSELKNTQGQGIKVEGLVGAEAAYAIKTRVANGQIKVEPAR